MVWIPVLAWAAAAVVAGLVLGYAGYQIWWRAARLRGDLITLTAIGDELTTVRQELLAAQERLSAGRVSTANSRTD